jgi:hypothetical protein
MNKNITRCVVFNCLIYAIIYVGVHYCNHDTVTCGHPQVLFGLWCSCYIVIYEFI